MEKKSETSDTTFPGINSIRRLNTALKEKKQNANLNSNIGGATKRNTMTGIPNITEKLEQNRIAKAAGSSVFSFVDENKIPKFAKLTEKKPDDYYRKFPNYAEENKRLKELFGAKTDFSITNYENNFDMMNPDEQTMFTGKAQGFFNRKGYTDKNGKRLKEDGIWGPKTQKTYEKYREDNGYASNTESDVLSEIKISDIKENLNSSSAVPLSKEKNSFTPQPNNPQKRESDPIYNETKFSLDNATEKLSFNMTIDELLYGIKPTNVLNKNLSTPSQDLYKKFGASANSRNEMESHSFNNYLSTYINNSDLRSDTTQYAIYKLMRSINNQKNFPSLKNIEVVNMLVSIMSTLTNGTTASGHNKIIENAVNSTTKYNISNNYNSVIKNWMRVFVALSDSCYTDNRVDAISATSISASVIDSAINQVINGFNKGANKVIVTMPAREGTQDVYDTSDKNAGFHIDSQIHIDDIGTETIHRDASWI